MSFDIPRLHLSDNSPEARVMEDIVTRDHVCPSEAILSVLRGLATDQATQTEESKKGGELLFGLFSDEPELMRRIAAGAPAARDGEIVKNLDA
jgi:hypothetical protein